MRILVGERAIAGAGMFFQSSAIENGNIASAVTDQLSALQLGRRAGHAAAADPRLSASKVWVR